METIQYLIITCVFVGAVIYVAKRFFPSKNQQGSCNKGCGCDFDKTK